MIGQRPVFEQAGCAERLLREVFKPTLSATATEDVSHARASGSFADLETALGRDGTAVCAPLPVCGLYVLHLDTPCREQEPGLTNSHVTLCHSSRRDAVPEDPVRPTRMWSVDVDPIEAEPLVDLVGYTTDNDLSRPP